MPAILTAILFISAMLTRGSEVQTHRFATTAPPPACRLPVELKPHEQLFRAGLQSLPEGLMVIAALNLGRGSLGLTTDPSQALSPLLADAYLQIDNDAEFANAGSALPYCFSLSRPTAGHYFMYRPDELPAAPLCIVFLHGWGGNFQFYTWAMKQELTRLLRRGRRRQAGRVGI